MYSFTYALHKALDYFGYIILPSLEDTIKFIFLLVNVLCGLNTSLSSFSSLSDWVFDSKVTSWGLLYERFDVRECPEFPVMSSLFPSLLNMQFSSTISTSINSASESSEKLSRINIIYSFLLLKNILICSKYACNYLLQHKSHANYPHIAQRCWMCYWYRHVQSHARLTLNLKESHFINYLHYFRINKIYLDKQL